MKFKNRNILIQGKEVWTKTQLRDPVYGERLRKIHGDRYREWNPKRSKLSAAILLGLRDLPLFESTKVLYLGASTGTTVSHVADLCPEGRVYAVEKSNESFLKLLDLARSTLNVFPILEDASKPQKYGYFIEAAEFLYQDIAQRNQVQIFNEVVGYFDSIEDFFLILKVRAITSRMSERDILKTETEKIENLTVRQIINLNPYSIANYLIVLK
ncbi:fibrillarin-like rRNA/tRNA 2'-O-methyltransferase [Thermoplasmatales archaeon AK]|nr:fibrillarin-like rRNA/tRNA 2'-O-methyltransferase [Thermoplasmatales archaeon AK]